MPVKREADVAPPAELMNDLIDQDARPCDGAADLEGPAEGGTQDVGRETARVHGIFRAADHLVQPGRAVAAAHVDGMVPQRGAHELQPFGQSRQIGHHLVGRHVVGPRRVATSEATSSSREKCVESIICTSCLSYQEECLQSRDFGSKHRGDVAGKTVQETVQPQIARIAVGAGLGHRRHGCGEYPADHYSGPELMFNHEFKHRSSFTWHKWLSRYRRRLRPKQPMRLSTRLAIARASRRAPADCRRRSAGLRYEQALYGC